MTSEASKRRLVEKFEGLNDTAQKFAEMYLDNLLKNAEFRRQVVAKVIPIRKVVA